MQLFKNKLKPEKQSSEDINNSNIGNGKSMIVHKTNIIEERRPLKTISSTENIYKDERELKKKVLEKEKIRNIFKDEEDEDKNIKSAFNQYKKGIVKRKDDEVKSIYTNKNKTYRSPEETEKLEITHNYKKSFPIPSDSFSQKTEVKHIKKYPKEETEIKSEKTDNRFISKTLKVDDKRKEKINYYRIPDATNIRFMETKISNRSQEKLRGNDEENKTMRNKTSDKGRLKYLQNLEEKEIKELIKEKYMFNEIDEEKERIEKELDYERIDKEMKKKGQKKKEEKEN